MVMPNAAKTVCTGCRRAIVPRGEKCDACKSKGRNDKAYENRRGSFRDRGYTTAWTAKSARYRTQHPLCVMCLAGGLVRPATCTDHIIPVECCPELVLS